MSHALALDHAALAAAGDRALTAAEMERVAAVARRRLAGEPIARIRGSKEFWGLDLTVTPDVLVPRPETETVVEAALAVVEAQVGTGRLRIADLGTGSGALLLALLYELPNARGIGTDRSIAALQVARGNAARHGLAERASFVACDYGTALAAGSTWWWRIRRTSRPAKSPGLAVEVRDFDPILALDGGPDGLAAYRAIASDGSRLLRPGGTMIVEIGLGQAEDVASILRDAGLTVRTPAHPDLAGIPRAVVASH